jgi:hypothetical protein
VNGGVISYPATQVENITFVDREESIGGSNGYPYVDMGLPSGKKWAVHNIGALSPEESGSCFAWGDVRERYNSYRDLLNSQWGLGRTFYAKYVGDKNVLEPADDAAAVLWGGDWHMPTYDDFKELMEHCTWILGSINGVKGYKVISKTNGNSLFFAMLGLWSSSGSDGLAASLLIRDSNVEDYVISFEEISLCLPIRPILP